MKRTKQLRRPVQDKSASSKEGALDLETHNLLVLTIPPASLVQLRQEILEPEHAIIFLQANKEPDFAKALGTIAALCDIALDGEYDVPDLCALLHKVLRNRRLGLVSANQPHLSDPRLLSAELIERADSIELVKVENEIGVGVIAPSTGRFVICDICLDSFTCISEKRCMNGPEQVAKDQAAAKKRILQ